ncbi:MAG TPA: tetratricopeptide repeat protein [Aliidongia sp.]|nr:tetratricopeptide repeat protein [Aliidongia sp.]
MPTGHPAIGLGLVTLSLALARLDRYAEARRHAEESVTILRAALGRHDATAGALDNLALILSGLHEPLAARAAALEAVEMLEQTLGPDHPRTASTLQLLSTLALKLGDFDEAEALLRRALAIYRAASREGGIAMALSGLGHLMQVRGRDAEAESHYREALEIRERLYGPNHPLTTGSLASLAGSKFHQGALAEAQALAEQALDRQIAIHGDAGLPVAASWHSLSAIRLGLGDYGASRQALDRAIEIRRPLLGEAHPLVVETRRAQGALLAIMGDFAGAETLFEQVLAALDTEAEAPESTRAATLDNLGLVLEKQGRSDEARRRLIEALDRRRALHGADHPDVALSLRNLGRFHLGTGDALAGGACLAEALAIRQRTLGPDHPETGASLADLAHAHLAAGDPPAARQYAALALAIALRHEAASLRWEAFWALSLALAAGGELPAAIHLGKMAVDAIQALRPSTIAFTSAEQQGFARAREPVYRTLADLLIRTGRLAEAQEILLLLKDEEFRAFLRQALGDRRLSFTALTALEARWRLDPVPGAAEAVESWLEQVRATFEATPAAVAEPALDLPALDAETALAQYLVTDQAVSIILATAAGRIGLTIELDRAILNRLVHEFRVALQRRTEDAELIAGSLYRHLVAPLEAHLGGISRLLVMLDGVLRYVPMAALHDGERYLVERFELATLTPAGRSGAAPQQEAWRVAGLGLARAVPGHAPLAAVSAELHAIIRTEASRDGLYPGTLMLDEDFTEASLLAALGSYPVTHIASHFVLDPADGLASYLLLGTGERLTLEKLRRQELAIAGELVALSACETAIGTGGEVEGLAALIQSRGARSVLATLWPVNDAGTAAIMGDFYATCRAGATKAAALRAAQAKQLGTRHPFYWAPFILLGDWR